MSQIQRRFAVLAALQALVGAGVAAITALVYFVAPQALQNASLTVAMAGSGAAVVAYYLSIHQILKKKRAQLSTIILSCLTALNVFLLIQATGGIDSPYYALWLLAIVTAGFFGQRATLVVLGITILYFAYEIILVHGMSKTYAMAHVAELILSIATAVMAEWIHVNLGRGGAQEQVVRLSGKLNEESLKSEAIMASVGEGVMVINSDGQIQLFNPSAARMTGWDAESAKGIDYRLVLNLRDVGGNKLSDDQDPVHAMFKSGKALVRNDLTMETKGGRKADITLSLSPIFDAEHAVSGSIALFRDISAEKEVERQRNEFISTASHEMRTPVAAIEGYLSLAMNPAVATIDERAKQYLDKAHQSTRHLGELFRDLLSITKMEDNRAGADEVFDLTAVVKDAVSDMKFEADKKGLELYFGASQDQVRRESQVLPVFAVRANPQRVREVVMNLIENAIKFTGEGHISVNISGANDAVSVSVTDTGIGIAPEDIPHLFQKFYRIDNSRTRTIGGTGLGLYLCRSIIERGGGRIWVESQMGQGSSFKFSLPRLSSDLLTANQQALAAAAAPAANAAAATQPTTTPAPAPVPEPAAPAPTQPAPAPAQSLGEPEYPQPKAPVAPVDPEPEPVSEPEPKTDPQPEPTSTPEPEAEPEPTQEPETGGADQAADSGTDLWEETEQTDNAPDDAEGEPADPYEIKVSPDGKIMTDIKRPTVVK